MFFLDVLNHLHIRRIDEVDIKLLSAKEIKVWKISKRGSLVIALIGYALISAILIPFWIGMGTLNMFFGKAQAMNINYILEIFIWIAKINRYIWYQMIHFVLKIIV